MRQCVDPSHIKIVQDPALLEEQENQQRSGSDNSDVSVVLSDQRMSPDEDQNEVLRLTIQQKVSLNMHNRISWCFHNFSQLSGKLVNLQAGPARSSSTETSGRNGPAQFI